MTLLVASFELNELMVIGFGAVVALWLVGAVFAKSAWQQGRATAILRRWARENRFELIESKNCFFLTGPFVMGWLHSSRQPVYRVVVRTADGTLRRGWVRLGGALLGLWTHTAKVKWAD